MGWWDRNTWKIAIITILLAFLLNRINARRDAVIEADERIEAKQRRIDAIWNPPDTVTDTLYLPKSSMMIGYGRRQIGARSFMFRHVTVYADTVVIGSATVVLNPWRIYQDTTRLILEDK